MTNFACGYVLPATKQRPTIAAEDRYNVRLQTVESLKRRLSLPSMSLKIQVLWNVTPCRLVNTNAKHPTWRNIPDELNLQQHICENLTPCANELIFVISAEDISFHRYTFA